MRKWKSGQEKVKKRNHNDWFNSLSREIHPTINFSSVYHIPYRVVLKDN